MVTLYFFLQGWMLVVSRFVRLGGFSSFSFFLFALAHFWSLPLAWWFCISALRGFSCSSVAVILLLLMKYVLGTFAKKAGRAHRRHICMHGSRCLAWTEGSHVRGISVLLDPTFLLHGSYMDVCTCRSADAVEYSRVSRKSNRRQTDRVPFRKHGEAAALFVAKFRIRPALSPYACSQC